MEAVVDVLARTVAQVRALPLLVDVREVQVVSVPVDDSLQVVLRKIEQVVMVGVPVQQSTLEEKMEGRGIDRSVAMEIEGADHQRVERQYLRLTEQL